MCVCMCVFICVCMCVCEREREVGGGGAQVHLSQTAYGSFKFFFYTFLWNLDCFVLTQQSF